MKKSFKPSIAVTGCFQNGKSTLINCLLDDYVAHMGRGDSTTHISTSYVYGEIQSAFLFPKDQAGRPEEIPFHQFMEKAKEYPLQEYDHAQVTLWKPILRDFDIIDTPGFNANTEDEERALRSVKNADYLLFVLSNEKGMSESEQMLVSAIASLKIPYVIILNCIAFDRWDPASPENDRLRNQIYAISQKYGSLPEFVDGQTPVWTCNLSWFWHAAKHSAEFSQEWEKTGRLIRNYFKIEGEPVPGPKELAEKSCFLPVRNFFQYRSWYELNIEKTLSSVRKAVKKNGRIDAHAAETVRNVLCKTDNAISRTEADFLFDLSEITFGRENDLGWDELFVKAVAGHVLENGQYPGEISNSDAEWLIGRIEAPGKIDDNGKALLRDIRVKAKRIPSRLKFKIGLWDV